MSVLDPCLSCMSMSWTIDTSVLHQLRPRSDVQSTYWTMNYSWIISATSVPFGYSKLQCYISATFMLHIQYTSSTAQGGGGSFKNRKPIGEVGCCESGMAERSHWWTERWLRSPLFLSLSLTIIPTYLSVYLCTYLSIDLFLSLSHI